VADFARLLGYLQRADVTELVLQTDKVAALKLSSGALHPVTKAGLGSAHIVALLEGVGWGVVIPAQDTGGQPQVVSHGGLNFSCRVARRGDQLQVRVVASASATAVAQPSPTNPPEPSPSPKARAEPSFVGRAPHCTWQSGSPRDRMHALLREARESGSTDVHVVGGQPARLRRLGELVEIGDPLPTASIEAMLLPLLEHAGAAAQTQLAESCARSFLPLRARGAPRSPQNDE
jgi:hypothetical protein